MSSQAITRSLPRASGRALARQTIAGLLTAAVAAGLTAYVTGRATLTAAAALLVIGGSLWFACTRRTALTLALLMVYLGVLDGYLKLATGSSYVTFVRDALLYAIVIGLFVRATVHGRRMSLPPLSAWVIGFVVLVLVQLANPQDGSLVHSLAGVRQSLEFVPLFFLTFAFVRTKRSLRVFLILLALIAAANGVANLVQFSLTPEQFAAWGPGYQQRVLGLGQFGLAGRNFFDSSGLIHTRPFGLGSEAGSGGLVAALALGAILTLASTPARRRSLPLAAITAAGAVVGIVTAQGRAVVICALLVVLAYALLTVISRRGLATVLAAAVVAAVSYVAVSGIVGGSGSQQSPALRYQGLSAGNIVQTTGKARGKSFSRIPEYLAAYPLGAGLGVAGPAYGTSGGPAQTGVLDAENEILFATVETGIPGMLVLAGFTVALLGLGVRRCRHEPDAETRILLAAIIAPLAGIVGLYSVSAVTPTTPCGPYLWAAGGIISYWLVARPAGRRSAGSEPIVSG